MKKSALHVLFSIVILFVLASFASAGVGPDGSFNYAIPIEVPPGTAGIAPNLSLVYNSNAGNGMLGIGWSLEGLGAITRDTTHPIAYSGGDYYVGPGGRLVFIESGDYAGDYHYENESFCRIEPSLEQQADGPAYWIETKPDGTKYYYGQTPNSRILALKSDGTNIKYNNQNCVRAWALSKVEDLHGNYYSITYETNSGEYYPVAITYTVNDSFPVSNDRTINFSYTDRSDHYTAYTYGCPVEINRLLDYISIEIDGTTRTYDLTYQQASTTGTSQLTGVEDDGSADGAWEFEWNEDVDLISLFNHNTITYSYGMNTDRWAADHSILHVGDFNGDGRSDILLQGKTNSWDSYLLLANGSEGFDNYIAITYRYGMNMDRWAADHSVLHVGDFNGDGRSDILLQGKTNSWDSYLLLANGSGGFDNYIAITYSYGMNTDRWAADHSVLHVRDFNGDGRSDILLQGKTNSWDSYLLLANGSGGFDNYIAITYSYGMNTDRWAADHSTLHVGDFNGDGRTDIMLQGANTGTDSHLLLFVSRRDNLVSSVIKKATSATDAENTVTLDYLPAPQFVDNISDGFADKAIDPANTTYSAVYPYIANSSARNLVASVTTSDGRGQSYETKYSYDNGRVYTGYPYQRKDMYFECVTEQTGSGPYTKTYYRQGIGTDDHFFAGRIDKVEQYDAGGRLMRKQQYSYLPVEHPYNAAGINLIKLQSITDFAYEKGDFVFSNTKNFNLYDSFGNPTQVTEQSSDTELPNIVTTTAYSYDPDKWIIARPSEIIQRQGSSGGTVLQGQRFYYNGLGELIAKENYLNDTYGNNRWIMTSFEYDSWGNVTSITSPNGAGGTSFILITYDTAYHTFPEYITNALGFTIHTGYNPATGNKDYTTDYNSNTTHYQYDEFARLTRVIEPDDDYTKDIKYMNWGNPGSQYTETRTRDNSTDSLSNGYFFERQYFDGLKRKYKTVSEGYNSGGTTYNRVVVYEYDALGRLSRQSNTYLAEGESPCDTVYYTTFAYDEAGRLQAKTYPDTTTESVSYTYEANRRVVRVTDKKGIVHVSKYDSRGKLRKRIDDPTGINASVTYDYDALGRLSSTVDAGGHITGISYDTLGRKTSMSDPNTGITSYIYRDSGQLRTQTDAKGTVLTFDYDGLNRLVSEHSSDDTVNVQYFYDMTEFTNSKGRLSRVADNSGDTTFAYDKKGNVTAYTKGIDDNGDGTTEKEFAVAMTYDYQKRVTGVTYPDPDHTVIKRQYADAGYLKAVTDNSLIPKAYVQYTREAGTSSLCSENSIQRITGNNVLTTIDYNPQNLRPTYITTQKRDSGGTILATLEQIQYEYDNNGNITWLRDQNTDPSHATDDTENFVYDPLNRLTNAYSSQETYYGFKNYAYSANGNLTGKDGSVLHYNDTSHPHAVTGFGTKAYSYDTNGNMTSRDGKNLVYDAKNRLIEVRSAIGDLEEKYTYDYTGFRVRKEIVAGSTVVYNINGLYELRKTSGNPDQFTNFIYGMEGDLVAQISGTTTSGASIFPIATNMYNWKDLKGFFLKLYAAGSAFFEKPENVRMINISVLILAILSALSLFAYNAFFRRRNTILIPRWMAHAIPGLLVVFFASFGLTGCFDGLFNNASVTGIRYFHPNHVGSVKMITDESGNVVANYKYDPYGTLLTAQSSGTDVSKYKYTAQESDESTGLYYYKARFYDPNIGRFITADTIVPNPADTQAYNRYMYADGDPINRGDPTGHYGWKKFWKDVKKVAGDAFNDATYRGAYKDGGWKGVNWKFFTGGIVTWSNEGGYGATASYQFMVWKIPCYVGVHWQQKGFNEGWTVFSGAGYEKNGFTAGVFVAHNFNNDYSSAGVQAGYIGKYGSGGIGYCWVWYTIWDNDDRDLVYHGPYGYGHINLNFGGDGTEEGKEDNTYQTSNQGDGRRMPLEWGAQWITQITGFEGSGNFFKGEGGLLMKALDIIGLHPVAVVHDYLNVNNQLQSFGDVSYFVGSMFSSSAYAYIVVGPNYRANPYATGGL